MYIGLLQVSFPSLAVHAKLSRTSPLMYVNLVAFSCTCCINSTFHISRPLYLPHLRTQSLYRGLIYTLYQNQQNHAMDFNSYEKYTIGDSPPASMGNSSDVYSHGIAPGFQSIDRAAEKKLVRRCDLHVLPVITILYSLAFVDRINIGNARLQGLEKDLHMKGSDYNIALFVFFIPYILLEVPSNILIRKIAPSTWLSSIMVLWGEHRPTHAFAASS